MYRAAHLIYRCRLNIFFLNSTGRFLSTTRPSEFIAAILFDVFNSTGRVSEASLRSDPENTHRVCLQTKRQSAQSG